MSTITQFGNLAWSTTQLISETSVVTPFLTESSHNLAATNVLPNSER